ncbi:MAG: aldehyde dehydrogenase family protein [Chthonomonadales bacterium]
MSSVAEKFESMEYGPAPEASGPANAFLDKHGRKFGQFIDGEFRHARGATYFETFNPATGEVLASVCQGTDADVDAAVKAARVAQSGWWKIGPHERAKYLYAIARQMQKQARLFATLETLDNGKSIRETRDIDIPLVARHFYHHAGWAQLMATEMPDAKPVGVAGQIIPWNFPLLMLAWKIAPAIAMGNTVVLKPAEFTPLTALLFGELCQEIGLPHGVVNIITGDGSTGEAIVKHPDIDKIAFTGSTEVGRIIRRATAGTGKKLSLELGGKSPFIVFEDADLDSVVEGVVDAIWFNQGQVCCAGSRLLVQESIEARLLDKIRARMEKLRIGDPMDKTTDIGAIIDPVQLKRIEKLVAVGVAEGSKLWQPTGSCPKTGSFYPPTLFTDVQPASTIAQVEIFGPVLVSMTFRTPIEAVELANNTPYGLAASVWTENINLALDIAPAVKAGTIWVNCTNQFDAASGFGGYKESGFGREGGREGLWDYVKIPHVAARTKHPNQPPISSNGTGTSPAPIDRTAKLYIGGKQVRPDSGYSYNVVSPSGVVVGEAPDGNRKDARNAVEAARAAHKGWSRSSGHGRAQILYFLAENLGYRADEFATRLHQQTERSMAGCRDEVQVSIEQIFTFAALADKNEGAVHHTPMRAVTIAMPESIGVASVIAPTEYPLLGFLSATLPLIAMGNTVVAVASEKYPFSATDLYQVFETSDVPSGVFNILCGPEKALVETIAGHEDVDVVWHFGAAENVELLERLSASNMKRTWCPEVSRMDFTDATNAREMLREATQIKNIWVPYGDGIPGLS